MRDKWRRTHTHTEVERGTREGILVSEAEIKPDATHESCVCTWTPRDQGSYLAHPPPSLNETQPNPPTHLLIGEGAGRDEVGGGHGGHHVQQVEFHAELAAVRHFLYGQGMGGRAYHR